MKYSYQGSEDKIAKVYGRDINVSWKKAHAVCRAIKDKTLEKAIKFLDDVENKKQFIEFKRYNKKMPHRTGGKKGRYVTKAVRIVKKLLMDLKSNAENKNLNIKKVKIIHSTAYKSHTIVRYSRTTAPTRGGLVRKRRLAPSNIELANIEIIGKEV
ncbi:MAG: 50S ribosomal protein L22 [archaeon]